MFGEFNGLPVHALVLHAAVVLAPLAGLFGGALLVPRWRRFVRWPFLVLTVLATASVVVARISGEALRTALGTQLVGTVAGDLIAQHADLATKLLVAMLVLLVLAVATVVLTRPGTSGRAATILSVGVTVVAAVVIVLTVQTGEVGSRAVWNPTGSVDYSGARG